MQFTKEHIIHGKGKNKTDRIKTICKLFLLIEDNTKSVDRIEISHGAVTQFYADQYDYWKKIGYDKYAGFSGQVSK